MLSEKKSEWKKLLDRLYGPRGILSARQSSVWWKDINNIDAGNSTAQGWFANSVKLKLGNGEKVKLWKDIWCGPWQLKELFPNLFVVAANQNVVVAEAGEWQGSCWLWKWRWRRQLTQEETTEAQLLEDTLRMISPDSSIEDKWIWTRDKSKNYKVKTAYEYLITGNGVAVEDEGKVKVLRRLWKTIAPSKYTILAWRLLRDGMPTRTALHHRGVLDDTHDLSCVLCSEEDETTDHLFFSCRVSAQLWQQVALWCGCQYSNTSDRWDSFMQNAVIFQHSKKRKLRHMVWLAVVWTIWTKRNNIIFREGGEPVMEQMMQQIKVTSWGWLMCKVDNKIHITFEDWSRGTLSTLALGVGE